MWEHNSTKSGQVEGVAITIIIAIIITTTPPPQSSSSPSSPSSFPQL